MEEKLMELKEEFLGKEIKLLTFDNEVQSMINTSSSIFESDYADNLEENGFGYETNDFGEIAEGYNFAFEIVEDNEDNLKKIVKITDIYIF